MSFVETSNAWETKSRRSSRVILSVRRCTSTAGIAASAGWDRRTRSEEHTSELQSRRDLVCRLLLEKKKKKLHPSLHRLVPRSFLILRPQPTSTLFPYTTLFRSHQAAADART